MKKILVFVILLLLVGCSKVEYDWEQDTIVIGMEAAYAPFNWLETEKSDTNYPLHGLNAYVEGYDVQIAKRIAEDLGKTLVIKMIDFKGLIPALETGMIDLIIAGMSPTEERMKTINFTEQYYESEHVVIVKTDSKYANATKFTDFTGARIVGQKSTLYDVLAEELAQANKATHISLDKVPEIVHSLNTGVNDVTIVEKPVAISIVNNHSQLKYIKLETPFTLDESDTIVSIGLRKIDNRLKDAVNAALLKISSETREQLMAHASAQSPGE